MDFLEEVKAKYWPSRSEVEKVDASVAELMAIVNGELNVRGAQAEVMLVGSMAKGTYLRDPDADIFLLYDPKVSREEMEAETLEMGKAILENPQISYAEHPYTKGRFRGLRVDLVPAYKVESGSDIMTAVDRTPFHTRFVKERLDDAGREEVRLLKAFAKGIGVYSAEARVKGFSGYLLELLVIHHGSFQAVLEDASRWKKGRRIEMVPSPKDFDDALVFIDPVDPSRNVSSALSGENFYRFIAAALAYLASPRIEFFVPRPVPLLDRTHLKSLAMRRGTGLLAVRFETPRKVDDVLYPQMDKALRTVEGHLRGKGFAVIRSRRFVTDRATLLFELEASKLPPLTTHEGPPTNHPNAGKFLERWQTDPLKASDPYIHGASWWVDVRRESREAKEAVLTAIPGLNLGKDINDELAKFCEVLQDAEVLDTVDETTLSDFFDNRPPWMR